MSVYLGVPLIQNIKQFSDVQRGTIFMWMFSAVVITVMVLIRLVMGQMEVGRSVYKVDQSKEPQAEQPRHTFFHAILNAQKSQVDEPGSVTMVKRADRFNTLLLPLIIGFALNFTLGATYSFSLVLFFIVITFVILFNLCQLHKKMFDHKVFIAFFDNIWLIATFFWFVNIWVTGKYQQPYFMVQI